MLVVFLAKRNTHERGAPHRKSSCPRGVRKFFPSLTQRAFRRQNTRITEEVNYPFARRISHVASTGLSGLSHHQKSARRGFAEGWVIYPPYPMGVPHRA